MRSTPVPRDSTDDTKGTKGMTKKPDVDYDAAFDTAYALDATALLVAARDDEKARKAARDAGQPLPSTPALDAFHRRYKEGTTVASSKSNKPKTERVKMKDTVRFTVNGMPLHESHMLGGVAFHYTEGLGTKGDEKKLDSTGLAALLKKLGVTDIAKPGWEVKLPNGVKVGTIKPEQVDAARAKAKAARGSSNGAAKKPAAKKPSGVTKKAAGKTTGASKPSVKGPRNPAARADARAAKKAPPAKKTAPAKKASASARAKAGVKPIPKKTTAKK